MKLAFITLTLLLLSNNIFSQRIRPRRPYPGGPGGPFESDGSDDCEEKSNDDETNADCCVKKPQPRWCPRMSVSSIKRNLSKLNRSSRARRFVNKEVAKSKSKKVNQRSFGPSGGPGGISHPLTHHNFWWPWICNMNPPCCFWCYVKWIWPFRFYNWWPYYNCIWNKC